MVDEVPASAAGCVARLPVRDRRGGYVYALVDGEAFDRLSRWTWKLTRDGRYAFRKVYVTWNKCRQYQLRLHREILGLGPGDPRQGDHINRNKLDNRRSNLRIVANSSEQAQNRGPNRRSRSGIRGVAYHKALDKWQAVVVVGGKYHYLGVFEDRAEAGRVASEFRRKAMPLAVEETRL